jgi:hypothetical protein
MCSMGFQQACYGLPLLCMGADGVVLLPRHSCTGREDPHWRVLFKHMPAALDLTCRDSTTWPSTPIAPFYPHPPTPTTCPPINLCRAPWLLAGTPQALGCTTWTVMASAPRARCLVWAAAACTHMECWTQATSGELYARCRE